LTITSHSQSGEDLQIAYLLGGLKDFTYIDVGCLWPRLHSNSYLFYQHGGSGLCVDPNPDVEDEFRSQRPRDTFLHRGIASAPGTLDYHRFGNPVFNTFSPDVARRRQQDAARHKGSRRRGRTLLETVSVPVTTLDAAIRERMPTLLDREVIDFLTIDVEGFEMEVFAGFSFKPLPKVIVVEHSWRRHSPGSPADTELGRHMVRRGYRLAGFMGHNLYFTFDD